ncbi:MAG: AzlD domain-containing protein [Pseudomonadales bacterium]
MIWWLIAAMALVTYVPRYLPLALAGKVVLPPLLIKALDFVPTAVLTAIIAQSALIRDGEMFLSLGNHHALAALAAFVAAVLSRQMFLSITVGLVSFAALKLLV